jgi:hypothetical protein
MATAPAREGTPTGHNPNDPAGEPDPRDTSWLDW